MENLGRVRDRIHFLVSDFCKSHKEFRMQDLLSYVESRVDGYIAPDSPGRILRDLRKKGWVQYEVIDRKSSLYRMKEEPTQGKLFLSLLVSLFFFSGCWNQLYTFKLQTGEMVRCRIVTEEKPCGLYLGDCENGKDYFCQKNVEEWLDVKPSEEKKCVDGCEIKPERHEI